MRDLARNTAALAVALLDAALARLTAQPIPTPPALRGQR